MAGVSWDALRVFVAVVRAGSLSAAAAELGMAQSSVSEQVARLERAMGFTLLERSPVGVRATTRGADLAARITEPIDALADALGPGEAGGGGAVGGGGAARRTIFVGGPAEFLSEVVLPGLASRLPTSVAVSARFGLAEELLEELRSGSIDVLVSALPVRGADLSSEPIYDEEFALVAHPDVAARADGDLASIPVLAYGPDLPIIRRYWRSVFGHRPRRDAVTITAPDLRTLLRLTLDGAGMTVLPDYLVRDHLTCDALRLLHHPEVAPLNTLYAVTLRSRSRDAGVVAVRDAVAASARAAAG